MVRCGRLLAEAPEGGTYEVRVDGAYIDGATAAAAGFERVVG